MPADAAAIQLRDQFKVSKHDDATTTQLWVTTGKEEIEAPIAILYIRNKTVIGVEHEALEHEIASANDLFDALFKGVSALSAEDRSACHVETGTGYVPGPHSLNKVFLVMNCGPRRLVVLQNTFSRADGQSISGYIVREQIGEVV